MYTPLHGKSNCRIDDNYVCKNECTDTTCRNSGKYIPQEKDIKQRKITNKERIEYIFKKLGVINPFNNPLKLLSLEEIDQLIIKEK